MTELEKLPPATQEGKQTTGFLLNGKAYVSKSRIEIGALIQNNFAIVLKGYADDSQVNYVMDINNYPPLHVGKSYTLAGNDTASAGMAIYANNAKETLLCNYPEPSVLEGELLITHYDYKNRVIAGTFWATFLTEDCDTARVTAGRFDLMVL